MVTIGLREPDWKLSRAWPGFLSKSWAVNGNRSSMAETSATGICWWTNTRRDYGMLLTAPPPVALSAKQPTAFLLSVAKKRVAAGLPGGE